MRVLLAVATAAVVALIWPQADAQHVCRSPMGFSRAAMPVAELTSDGAPAAVGPSGGTPGVERSRCALRLRLLDEVTGKPFSSDVELWRLDLPEDEEWTAGDHLQATKNVGPDGGMFTDLPAGRYRIVARGQSFLAEIDPPAFLVRGAFTDQEFSVRAPQPHRVYLQVFDERGLELRTAKLRHHDWSWYSDDLPDPAWMRRRQPKRASASLNRSIVVGGGIGWGCSHGHRDGTWTEAGFHLGRCWEDTRKKRSTDRWSVLVAGHSAVTVDIDGRLTGERTYVAVSVSLAELAEHVYLPDGRRAADAGALFEASSGAVERKPSLPPDAWRSLAVMARVGLAGYEILTFEYRVDRPPVPQVMRPGVEG